MRILTQEFLPAGLFRASLITVVVTSSACQTIAPVQRLAADALLPVSDENKLGVQLAAEVEKKAKLHADNDVQAYVSQLGNKLAASASDTPKGIRFTFKVIDDDETVNAFALPGGHVYVYTGLMKLADDEAELASVLAHEIAHVTQRHIAERLVTQLGLQTVLRLTLGQDPGLLAQIAARVAATGAVLSFTREQESDADEHGLPYAVASGYDPLGFVRLFTKLRRGEGPAFLAFLRDHPLPSQRIDDARARIARMRNPPTTTNKAQYEAIQSQV